MTTRGLPHPLRSLFSLLLERTSKWTTLKSLKYRMKDKRSKDFLRFITSISHKFKMHLLSLYFFLNIIRSTSIWWYSSSSYWMSKLWFHRVISTRGLSDTISPFGFLSVSSGCWMEHGTIRTLQATRNFFFGS